MGSCHCAGSSCAGVGASWSCDEWELPKTRDLFYPDYLPTLFFGFVMTEVFAVSSMCMFFEDRGYGHALPAEYRAPALAFSCCLGFLGLPFLILTFGFYGFLFAGGIFWIVRLGCCCYFYGQKVKLPDMQKYGASRIIGRPTTSGSGGSPQPREQQDRPHV